MRGRTLVVYFSPGTKVGLVLVTFPCLKLLGSGFPLYVDIGSMTQTSAPSRQIENGITITTMISVLIILKICRAET